MATKTKNPLSDEKQNSLMGKLLEEQKELKIPEVNAIIEGKVITASKNEVHLDIDGIACGVVRGPELFDESGEYTSLKIGDKVSATVLELENEDGELELSFRQAGHKKAWDELERLMREGETIDAEVLDANKGGLIMRVSRISGFLPVSQLTVEHYPRVEGGNKSKILERLQSYAGQKFKVAIIDVDEADNKLIVSEKSAWEDQHKAIIAKYKVGDCVEGRITGVVDFGAFIEFGEGDDKLEGLVHISELAWQRIDDPRKFVKVGDPIKAQIISIDDSKISLSIRRLQKDPWAEVVKKYTVGQKIKGVVLKINHFGAFVELDKDIHGLAHISELSSKKINDPSEIVKIGDEYEFKIISIEPQNHRLGLSMKALKEKPKEEPDSAKATAGEEKEEKKDEAEKPAVTEEKKEEETKPEEKNVPAKQE
ncbi:MAG: S1 RNA-binding domain-containing protein [Patescibacteria group bacterium]|jgi:small subunit ribosomal protein S1